MTVTSHEEQTAARTHASLDHLALLVVRGADARSFLDSQLTRNVPTAGAGASPAGYCSPKGRLLASFVVWSTDDAVFLIVSRDIASAIAKRLRMYVLRAKAVVDEPGDLVLDGLQDAMSPSIEALPVWGVIRIDADTWIRWPDADGRRWLRVAAGAGAPSSIAAARWRWLDIRAGLPTITAPIQDRFVPQMLNLEALGGVDFKKGCYPGQEVVARSQYLGKLKRRTALASLDGTAPLPIAGSDVFADGRVDPVGFVVAAERDPDGGPDGRIAVLIEVPIEAAATAGLRAGSAACPALTVEPLPYALPDNEVFVRPKL